MKHCARNFTQEREVHGENSVFSTAQRLKKANNLMLMLGLKETIDQLAIANSVRWYGQVLRREDGHVLKRALDIEVEGQRKK